MYYSYDITHILYHVNLVFYYVYHLLCIILLIRELQPIKIHMHGLVFFNANMF